MLLWDMLSWWMLSRCRSLLLGKTLNILPKEKETPSEGATDNGTHKATDLPEDIFKFSICIFKVIINDDLIIGSIFFGCKSNMIYWDA